MYAPNDIMLVPCANLANGDYQINAPLALSKRLNVKPRVLAQLIIDSLVQNEVIADAFEAPEIGGPGFINLTFKKTFIERSIYSMSTCKSRLNLPYTSPSPYGNNKIIVDYSSPNIAKQMHVGHLRSTLLGSTLSNLFEFQGYEVKRLNHLGDWGTQFGMLCCALDEIHPSVEERERLGIDDLIKLYKEAKVRFDSDAEFKEKARATVIKLQSGDPSTLNAWKFLCKSSSSSYNEIYSMLGIEGLEERGESFYNSLLSEVVGLVEKSGISEVSDGALVVYPLPQLQTPVQGQNLKKKKSSNSTKTETTPPPTPQPIPLIIRKSDGGYNYASTDLAAIYHRTNLPSSPPHNGEQASRVLYVTDSGQALHFKNVFETAHRAALVGNSAQLLHVGFGVIQGSDGKKFATRSGDTVKLIDLLNEAIRISGIDVAKRNNLPEGHGYVDLPPNLQNIAREVGIGSVKYADLSMNRESSYRFDYDKMLNLNGNTAGYMLYVYARVCGVVRKGALLNENENESSGESESESESDESLQMKWPSPSKIAITEAAELQLTRHILKLPDTLHNLESDLCPHKLCDYLYELSAKFNAFYEACPVNKIEVEKDVRMSRLNLCAVTGRVMLLGLGVLGIKGLKRL